MEIAIRQYHEWVSMSQNRYPWHQSPLYLLLCTKLKYSAAPAATGAAAAAAAAAGAAGAAREVFVHKNIFSILPSGAAVPRRRGQRCTVCLCCYFKTLMVFRRKLLRLIKLLIISSRSHSIQGKNNFPTIYLHLQISTLGSRDWSEHSKAV